MFYIVQLYGMIQEILQEMLRNIIKEILSRQMIEILQNYMNWSQTQTQSDQYQKDVSLKLDLLKDINLSKYPPHRLHFLVYALQKGIKLPSESSMKRCERRNHTKIGANQANSVIKRIKLIITSQKFSTFRLPHKYGSKLIYQDRSTLMIGRRRQMVKFNRFRRPAHVVIKKSISLPSQTQTKTVAQRKSKAKILAYRNHSPHWILSKAAREAFIRQIQNHSKLKGINVQSQNVFSQVSKINEIPAYFKKKKANQKRRRRQKHLLIQSNRAALVQIFGDAVFKRGWPVSRKQIKLALGIKEEDHMKTEFLGQFMEMAQKKNKKLPPPIINFCRQNQVSRMVRRIDISKKQHKENFDFSKKISSNILITTDLKSKRVFYRPAEEQFPSLFNLNAKKGQKQ